MVDCVLEYSAKHKAGLIIMGSQQVILTSLHSAFLTPSAKLCLCFITAC